LGLALGLAFSAISLGRRALAVIIGAGAVVCNLLTYALGGLVGMLAAVVSALVLYRRRRVVIPLALAVVLLVGLSPTTLTSKAERVLTGRAVTAAARLVTYKQALTIMVDHPIVGVGWGSIRSFMEEEYRVTRAHAVAFAAENYFLQRGVALGLPGIILFVILCVLFFRNALWPRGDPAGAAWPRAAIIVGGVAFYFQAQTFPAASATSGHLLWLLFALAEAMHESSVRVPPGPGSLPQRREPGR
jgi:O-antigen ligase